MTDTERALQAALDASPEDQVTRGVLADYLDEIGDPRAAGYRAMCALGRYPRQQRFGHLWQFGWNEDHNWLAYWPREGDSPRLVAQCHADVPECWMAQAGRRVGTHGWLLTVETRRGAEDALARGWSHISQEKRLEVMSVLRGPA